MNNRFLFAPLSVAITSAALQLPCHANEEKKFNAELELGLIATGGNTKTESYKGKLDAKHDLESWAMRYILQGLFKEDQVEDDAGDKRQETTAEKYFGSTQADYKINKEHAAFFGYVEYDRNRFSGFDYQYTVALGYADRLFTRDNSFFAYSIGPGFTVSQAETTEGSTEKPAQDENGIVRVALEYVYEFSKTSKFSQKISSNYVPDSDENTKTKSESAVTAALNGSLALRAAYVVDYNSQVADDREHADTETSLTVVYSF